MRERLIELLEKGQELYYDSYGQAGVFYKEFIADYLLANGIIVPPCKVGDTVYQVATERIYESKIKQVIYDVGHFGFDESAIGTSVFLTKGEAEQALKERDSK